MLERLGYHVTSRIISIEALETFRAAPDKFDLVITDMAMHYKQFRTKRYGATASSGVDNAPL